MTTPQDFAGKVVLITGIGGGQGRAASLLFAAHGAIIIGCDIDAASGAETAAQVRAKGGVIHAEGAVDLGDPEQARQWVETAAQAHGGIDVLYNNGSAARAAPIGEMSVEDWQFTIRNELDLVFYVTRYAWRHLVAHRGVIINIASAAGHGGSRSVPMAAHSAAKGAIIALTRQLAVEGAAHGIRAVSISPGLIETPGTAALLADPAIRAALVGDSLIPRPGHPEEVATLALYLASGAASFITGADFLVDGGRMAS